MVSRHPDSLEVGFFRIAKHAFQVEAAIASMTLTQRRLQVEEGTLSELLLTRQAVEHGTQATITERSRRSHDHV